MSVDLAIRPFAEAFRAAASPVAIINACVAGARDAGREGEAGAEDLDHPKIGSASIARGKDA
ncbi:MAG: hypothetical protein ABIQ70_08405, partial [Dokdonella sp.]